MAARRLLIVMVVLLLLSSLAAALVPAPPERSGPGTSEEDPQPEEPITADGGEFVRAGLDAGAAGAKTVRVRPGDQLALTVRSDRFREVTIPAYGELETALPGSPARFDLLVERRRPFEVRLLAGRRVIGRIAVASGSD